MDREKGKKRIHLTFLLAVGVFLTVIVVFAIIFAICRLILKINIIQLYDSEVIDAKAAIAVFIIASIIVGYGLSLLFSKLLMNPINKVVNAMQELAKGNFKERLSFGSLDKHSDIFHDVSDSFNKMASELEHTETISSDFMNNFSHEFKTPIVSISGFTKLLKKGNLTKEQETEYLNIIDEESSRLTYMATSVLKLIKVENQTILSNITKFNLSEQIRNCILLLEDKWSKKNIELQLDFDEFYIHANEELLKQVWINLLDNAVKFTPEKHLIKVDIKEKDENIIVSIINTGSEIPASRQKHIFNKFYQADESHSSQGSGLGLAIVKKIVDLHKGQICVISGNQKTIFLTTLHK